MARPKKGIRMAIAETVEMELAQAKAIGWSEEGRRLDDELNFDEELDFDRQDFGMIEEEES